MNQKLFWFITKISDRKVGEIMIVFVVLSIVFIVLATFCVLFRVATEMDYKVGRKLWYLSTIFLWFSFLFTVLAFISYGKNLLLLSVILTIYLLFNIFFSYWVVVIKDKEKQIEEFKAERNRLSLYLQSKEKELESLSKEGHIP